jgi:hypothetical protein
MVYKKPYDQISEKKIKETYREIFCFGLAKDDLPDDWFGEVSFKDMMCK